MVFYIITYTGGYPPVKITKIIDTAIAEDSHDIKKQLGDEFTKKSTIISIYELKSNGVKKEINELKTKIQELEMALRYLPIVSGTYQQAHEHFKQNSSE